MSTTKNQRRGMLPEKSSSFHGKSSLQNRQLLRPSTQPNLQTTSSLISNSSNENMVNRPQLTKLLLNVTMLGSFGPVHVVMSMDATVADLICCAVRQYAKEGRRPVLPATDPSCFDLHYSQFCLECLDREERLVNVWSRNLLLCPKTKALGLSCAEEVDVGAKPSNPWLNFMNFLR